jgi:muconolactone delta-isomerase
MGCSTTPTSWSRSPIGSRPRRGRAAALPGATDVTDLVAMDGSHHAAVAFDIDDLDALKTVLSSVPPEMAAQAESHGVIMAMTVYVQA